MRTTFFLFISFISSALFGQTAIDTVAVKKQVDSLIQASVSLAQRGDFDKALELDPKSSEAFNGKGYVQIRSNQLENAISNFNQALSIQPEYATAYNGRGICNSLKTNYDAAISDFSKALELDKEYSDAYNG